MPIFILAFLLGLRHGIDWDHIAALTDVTGTSGNKKDAFLSGLLYIAGHAFVVLTLGLTAIVIGVNLPDWVDPLMEKFVGISLLFLGFWLLATILKQGKKFRPKSRWMLILEIFNRISFYLHNKIPHQHKKIRNQHGFAGNIWIASCVIGMIHGIGAETPTQVLIFLTAAGVGHGLTGIILLTVFVTGLMLSNTLISLLSIFGYTKLKDNTKIYLGLGLLTAIFSLAVGFIFTFSLGYLLPRFF